MSDNKDARFIDFAKRKETERHLNSESHSTKGEGSLNSVTVSDPKELKRLAARSKRAEVRSRLNKKRARKELEKKKEIVDEESVPVEASNKKKDTVWKIIMPGKDRRHATYTEQKVVREIENLIDKHPQVQRNLTQLKEIDEAIQMEKPSHEVKEQYTQRKNRISAQLSRDRRS